MSAQITLQSGERVKLNDHVYCSPNWSARDGTPYSVARIMEFLPPASAANKGKGKDRENSPGRVRLAWYYRPTDVSDRPTADSRLLLAAIYSEICDVAQLRAKCYVAHRDKISDLAGWKKRPDRFYFNRVFDPYIKKEFEVIQSTAVRNIPERIRDVLIARYEYVVAEKEIVPNLTDSLRSCETCQEWCPHSESVQCDRCKLYFHMSCVSPPLAAKPSRGYGWTCAPCSRQHEEAVDAREGVRHTTPVAANGKPKPVKANIPPARGRGRPRKDRSQAEREENLEVKTFKMWPFRYFGLYTVAEDTLDEDDFIFPRAVTRVGPKYQATGTIHPDVEERGGDGTVEVLSIVHQMQESEMVEFERSKMDVTHKKDMQYNVDWLTEVTRRLSEAWRTGHSFATVSMKSPLRIDKWKKTDSRYIDRPWNDEEMAAFEDAIMTHGAELRAVREEVGTRTMPEVVRYYGHWKNSKLRDENRQKKAGTWVDPSVDVAASSDDEGSIVGQPARTQSCGACRTRESRTWWKAPKAIPATVLCDTCGQNWRKYADLNVRPVREDVVTAVTKLKGAEKREGTPLTAERAKRAKTHASTSTATASATPPAPQVPAVPQLQCAACNKKGPVGKVLKCTQCKFQIHAGACGAVLGATDIDSWVCELCQNEKTLEASLNTDCMLCPRRRRDRKKGLVLPPPDSFLRACKPTEGQGWAHVLCSIFVPEVTFTDESRLRLVEGISSIPSHRWSKECGICKEEAGAVVRCAECPREYHVSCAWKSGYKMGFEVLPVKLRHRDTATIVDFKGESGSMTPIIRCKHHDNDRAPRRLWGICDVDDETGMSALQIYAQHYKRAQVDHSYGLLRKARRLDAILTDFAASSNSSENTLSNPNQECQRCHTEYSPFFYPISADASSGWLCHKCHFEGGERTENGARMVAVS